jgi:hypothetical protein
MEKIKIYTNDKNKNNKNIDNDEKFLNKNN